MLEIGSEFSFKEINAPIYNNFPANKGACLTYSGRSSIFAVLQDILKQRAINGAWLPSYCCSSMLQPFNDLNIPIQFYAVNWNPQDGIVRTHFVPQTGEIVLLLAYFGFEDMGKDFVFHACQEQCVPLIEDCTHCLLSQKRAPQITDYRVASLRKWFPLASGGAVWKRDGAIERMSQTPDKHIIALRREAMEEKARYLCAGIDDPALKQDFLEKYRYCNRAFENNYQNISIDSWSAYELRRQNVHDIRAARRRNVAVLLYGLCEIPEVRPLFASLQVNDCPLFVPIFAEQRDELQQWMAQHSIYCPAHWSKPNEDARSNLYESELSLICDQRYGTAEMERILQVLKDFYKR